jgi:diguanylate cyclase (GGDEF)-like protein
VTETNLAVSDDQLDILDDGITSGEAPRQPRKCWRILIVDDDREVHNATLFALHDVLIDGRPLQFLHAYSAAEARAILHDEADIAVALLDVVMEEESSGLDLVQCIRQEFGLSELRIILRTGQPGYAPELRVIREYDINDYKTKSELTQIRLLTTLTTAIRSFDQIRTIMAGRRGLTLIVNSAADLFSNRSLAAFAEGVLTQLAALLGLSPEGLLCARNAPPGGPGEALPLVVIGAAGKYNRLINRPLDELDVLDELDNALIVSTIRHCFAEKKNIYGDHSSVLYFKGDTGKSAAVFLATPDPLSDTDKQLLEVFCVNISIGLENVNLFSDLEFLAYADPLTWLPNRKGFIDAIDSHRKRGELDWTVALIDIDHFSEINDALGHQKGDKLLLAVAQRLGAALGEGPVLARINSDVFGLLAPDAQLDPATLLALFTAPIAVDDYRLPVHATIGLTRLADGCDTGLDLLKTTNIALNRAKKDHRGRWQYYTHDMTVATRERLDLMHKLRIAITEKRGLEVHYQPQIDLSTSKVIGAEALVRWTTDDGRSIPPDQFIPLAESSGLIIELGEWVFRTAITQLMAWDSAGLPALRMAINVSPTQFREPRFASRLQNIIEQAQVPAHRIELEITEGVAMFDPETVIATLTELRALGIEIAVDDFGTGFSSLSYLHRLPINRLKIDRSFIRDMESSGSGGATIADMVVKLGQSLGLSVIAEGTETAYQVEMLRNIGCELAQGYLYSRPVNAEAFGKWLSIRD